MTDKEQEERIALAVKFEREKSVLLEALAQATTRISELEEFVRFVKIRENGSNYDSLRRQAEKVLEKDL